MIHSLLFSHMHCFRYVHRRFIQTLKRSTVELSYTVHKPQGATSGVPALLILHGLFGSKQNWNSLSKLLAKKYKGQIITVDARNHGNSGHSAEMDYPAMAADTAALMERLGLDSAVLLGHSMGGKTAMTLALTQPRLLEALIVADVSPCPSPAAKLRRTYAAVLQDVELPDAVPLSQARRQAEQQLASVIESAFVRKFLLMNLEETNGQVRWKVNLDAIDKNCENLLGFPQFLSQYTGPTLFLGGEKSNYIVGMPRVGSEECLQLASSGEAKESNIPDIKRYFPHAKIEHIAGASHYLHAEKPHSFADSVLHFLRQVVSQRQ